MSKEINAAYGRCTPMPPRLGDDGEEVAWENEEFVEPLRSLSLDAEGSWRSSTVPECSVSGQVAVIKSLTWPGAAVIGAGSKFTNIYVGDGVKFSPDRFQPALPDPLAPQYGIVEEAQWSMLSEQPDVTQEPVEE